MATSSIKAPIRVTSPEGVRALCEAYEKGMALDEANETLGKKPVRHISKDKQTAIDELFQKMGL